MRSIWNGAIGFGLVNIPVKIYSASSTSTLDLDMLDKEDHAHIKYKRVNENTGKEVEWGQIVKGYMIDDKYVVLDDDDFEKASPEKSKIIGIDQFVMEEEIDSIYFNTPYYLEPQKSGTAAYSLMVQALEKSKKVAVGTFVLRNKELLGIIRPYKGILLLNKIRFAEEIRDSEELKIPALKKPKEAELKMALALIDQLSGPLDLEKFKDTYSADLLKIIEQKAKGTLKKSKQVKLTPSKAEDLMAQLKASLSKIAS